MGVIQYIRLASVLFLGVIPALILSIFAGLGLLMGITLFFSGPTTTGLMIAVVSSLGIYGAYSICDTAMGATKLWQQLGLLSGIFAACTFVYFALQGTKLSPQLEPTYWPLLPSPVAAYLLLESYLIGLRKDERSATLE